MSPSTLWQSAGLGQVLILLGLVWLMATTAKLAVAVWRAQRDTTDTDTQLVDEARNLARLIEAHSHALLQELALVRAAAVDVAAELEDLGKAVAQVGDVLAPRDPRGGAR
jgi:hypothetical protein